MTPLTVAISWMVRNTKGDITATGVAESTQPFEVGLGPLASGRVGAVYPRCTDAVLHHGCRLE